MQGNASVWPFAARWVFEVKTMNSETATTNCYHDVIEKSGSPLEERFWHFAFKARNWKCVESQKKIGRFFIDGYFVSSAGRRVAVELDGSRYHDVLRDSKRDAIVLASGVVDEVIRIPFSSMWFYPFATFKVLSEWNSEFSIPTIMTCLSFEEFENELIEVSVTENRFDYVNRVDRLYEIFNVCNQFCAFACSVKTAMNRYNEHSKLQYISRRIAGIPS